MAMKGFDPEFRDIPDYIVKITERIWEGRGVGLIRRWYSRDCTMHTSNGPVRGAEAVVAGTLDTLSNFPDRRLLPADIIWSGDEEAGFLSSHRVSAPSTHLGDGLFGPPTGREIHILAIADCFCRNNQVVEEWLVRDGSGIVRQLGLDLEEFAGRLAMQDELAGKPAWHLDLARQLRDGDPVMEPVLQSHPAAALVRDTLHALWNDTDLGAVTRAYHPACVVHAPGARTLHGHARFDRWLLGYLAAFPDARLAIEHSIARDDPGHPTRVATRWWLTGTHAGTGAFGSPSGATVLALGVTHSVVIDGLIREEWIVTDEIALHKQIALQKG